MKHCYAAATPDFPAGNKVFGLTGDFDNNLRLIKDAGFDGLDLVPLNPSGRDIDRIVRLVQSLDLMVPAVCTGEIVKLEGLSLSDKNHEVRKATVSRFKTFIDLASELGACVNIGRSRGTIASGESCVFGRERP